MLGFFELSRCEGARGFFDEFTSRGDAAAVVSQGCVVCPGGGGLGRVGGRGFKLEARWRDMFEAGSRFLARLGGRMDCLIIWGTSNVSSSFDGRERVPTHC